MTKWIVSFRNFSNAPVLQTAFFVPGKRCYHPAGDKCSRNCFVLLLTLCYALSVVGAGQFSSSVPWTCRSENRCLIPRRHNRFVCSSKPQTGSEIFYFCSLVGAGDFCVGVQRFFPSGWNLCCPQRRKFKKDWSSTSTGRSMFIVGWNARLRQTLIR